MARRTARRAYAPKRRRRRRNPTARKQWDVMGSVWAAAAGGGVALAGNALDSAKGEWATPKGTAGALLAGTAVLGLLANRFFSDDLGKGLISGGVALGGYKLYKAYEMEKAKTPAAKPATTEGMGYVFQPPQMAAVQGSIGDRTYATMNAVKAEVAPGYEVNLNDAFAQY